jgi:hypothetical protein
MGVPRNFGMSKISHMRGEAEGPYGARMEMRGSKASHAWRGHANADLAFSLPGAAEEGGGAEGAGAAAAPSFNVLYVSTPRIGLLQTPEFRGLAALWQETVDMVAPWLRFGFPETSLRTKCQHYECVRARWAGQGAAAARPACVRAAARHAQLSIDTP